MPRGRTGYTLIEMLTTVAALVIVLGLMVSLARFVRYRSSTELTQDLLVKLEQAAEAYARRYDGQLPPVGELVDGGGLIDESRLQESALENNRRWVRALRQHAPLRGGAFADLPISMYDEHRLLDAWGQPIVLMFRQHPAIGMAPDDRFFFFSAGPDRRYLTRDDNLYSYEGEGRRR